eukprot:CAMPEP_0170486208 /NCGR_PEP_ID=MMETSP0208-20121228/5274_1 /TAXON_ID=197538 /ORGANISM="Strombidium inclinatum, Strain S3" /LENGTH=40 /DNA_ID= /DNA_START= /DNA_END= /DNA_ORIENTATION=
MQEQREKFKDIFAAMPKQQQIQIVMGDDAKNLTVSDQDII